MAMHDPASESPLARFAELFDRAAREGAFDHTAATLATADAAGGVYPCWRGFYKGEKP